MTNAGEPEGGERWEARETLVADWEFWQVWAGERRVADFIVTREEAEYICGLHNARLSSAEAPTPGEWQAVQARVHDATTKAQEASAVVPPQAAGGEHAPAPWRISGYAGEHDESGAHIVDADGKTVASTYGGMRDASTPEEWRRYRGTAELIARAPTLEADKADLTRRLAETETDLQMATRGWGDTLSDLATERAAREAAEARIPELEAEIEATYLNMRSVADSKQERLAAALARIEALEADLTHLTRRLAEAEQALRADNPRWLLADREQVLTGVLADLRAERAARETAEGRIAALEAALRRIAEQPSPYRDDEGAGWAAYGDVLDIALAALAPTSDQDRQGVQE